jgi:hypothetical protein
MLFYLTTSFKERKVSVFRFQQLKNNKYQFTNTKQITMTEIQNPKLVLVNEYGELDSRYLILDLGCSMFANYYLFFPALPGLELLF